MSQKIIPFLWFDGRAEEAMSFYTGIFKNSRVVSITRYDEANPAMKGKVLTGVFELEGQRFMALDGGPQFHFTEAVSLYVDCRTQEEVDELWNRLSTGGEKGRCGWLKDKYGLSWQIIPAALGEMLQDKDAAKAGRVMAAMLKMSRIDIAELRRAYEQ